MISLIHHAKIISFEQVEEKQKNMTKIDFVEESLSDKMASTLFFEK